MIAKKDVMVTLLVSEMNIRQIDRHAKRYASLTFKGRTCRLDLSGYVVFALQ